MTWRVRAIIVCLVSIAATSSPAVGEQFLVAQDGAGTHGTIQGAMTAAGYGDVIRVNPGVYEEGVVFKNGVSLVGSGAGATVIRYGYGFEPVVYAHHASVGRIEGFSIERTETTLPGPTVLLESASITIVDCTITGSRENGLEIAETTSAPTLEGVRIHGNDRHGVWAHDGARVRLTACRIEENGGNGILLTGECTVTLETTTISDNGVHGLTITDASSATAVGCEFRHQTGWGVDLSDRGQVRLTSCRLIDNASGGLRLSGDSDAAALGCAIVGGETGVEARDRTAHRIEESSIRASRIGVAVAGEATGAATRSEISACETDGLDLSGDGEYVVDRTTVVRNGRAGVLIRGSAVSITNTIIAYNVGAGVRVDRPSGAPGDLLLSHNNVWGNDAGDYQGVTPRTTDLTAPPDFVDLEAGNIELRPASPCIGRGLLGETIGAHDDPTRSPIGRIEFLPTYRNAIPGLDLSAFARIKTSPFELEAIELAATHAGPRGSVLLSTSFLGAWGARTTAAATFESSVFEVGTGSLSWSLHASGVLDGLESRIRVSAEGELIGSGYRLASSLSRTWPSSRWVQAFELSLGTGLRATLSARTANLVPESFAVAVEGATEVPTGTLSGRGGIVLGPDRLASAAVDWEGATRSLSVIASTYLDSPGHASLALALDETAAGLDAELVVSLSDFAFHDGEISVSKRIGSAELTARLGIDALGRARASLRVVADFDRLLASPPNLPPVPSFTVRPIDARDGEPVHFDATASTDEDGNVVEYWWDFGDDDAELGEVADHTFETAGSFTVTLTVADDDGATAIVSRPIEVAEADETPVAEFLWEPVTESGTRLPRPPRAGDWLRLDATAAYDPSGERLEYHWDLESDGEFDLVAEEAIVVAPPLEAGTHPVTLRVVNEAGRADAVMHAVIVSEPKPPSAGFAFTPTTPSILDPIRFSDLSSDVDGNVVSWEWTFGDDHSSRETSPIHRYDEPGTYAVRLTVTDDDGLAAFSEETIAVAQVPEIVVTGGVFVLAIGISDYENVADLQFGRADAIAAAQWALDEGVPPDHVRLLTDAEGVVDGLDGLKAERATLVNVRESLGWIRRMAAQDDLVVIFFSGHGYQGADDDGDERDGVDEFFVLVDTVDSAIDDTALRDDEFGRFLDRVPSQHVLVFFDGCYSGGLARSLPSGRRPTGETLDLFRDFSLEGRLILSAAAESQDAFESPTLGHGVFTHFVLEGLRGAADLNEDSHVTAWEVYEYVLAEVPPFVRRERGADQTPQIVGEGDVRVLLASHPPPPVAAFSYTPTVPFVGGPVRFRDESSGRITCKRWTFGDGSVSDADDPIHVFEQEGAFTVTLEVQGATNDRSDSALLVRITAEGRVIGEEGDLWVISLGAQNGVALGDRFRAVGSEAAGAAVLEVVALIDGDSAACRSIGDAAPSPGDVLRPILATDGP